MRYAHNIERVLDVPSQAVALLATLMLRGPQTLGELRINCDRLHRFADGSAVEAFLHELADSERGRAGSRAASTARRARESLGASAVGRSAERAARAVGPQAAAARDGHAQAEFDALKAFACAGSSDELAALKSELAGLRCAAPESNPLPIASGERGLAPACQSASPTCSIGARSVRRKEERSSS